MKAREAADEEAALWRRYVADSLFYSGQNKRLARSYSELLDRVETGSPAKPAKAADDIVADIIKRHGIHFERKEQNV